MVALPRIVPLGYGKAWVEGIIDDQDVIDTFNDEYGQDPGCFLRMVKTAIYLKLESSGVLDNRLGPMHGRVTPGLTRPVALWRMVLL